MVYVDLNAAFRVARAVTGSVTLANAIERYMTHEHLIDIVRCGECVHSQKDELFGGLYCNGRKVWTDHFCSCGKRKTDLSLPTDNSNRCVCCGEIIPEGRMVCPSCERRAGE